jgi:glutamate synthase domain-containing protein 2/glutamate synthase domain-containing protein 1/glutamate synthase domain-containing protein 3
MFGAAPAAQGLYDPNQEHDACGVGFVANIHGVKSNKILEQALGCVCSLVHRGAVDADAKTGDGAGVLTQLPHKLFVREVKKLGKDVYNPSDLAVGMFFLPAKDAYVQAHCRKIAEDVVTRRGLVVAGWRAVPSNPKVLGDKAAATAPQIEQLIVLRPDSKKLDDDAFEQTLFHARKEIESLAARAKVPDLYICSFSSRTIVYKGMFTAPQLERFYLDLQDPDYETAIAVYHQRYSTNTFPTWPLAHPFRMLAHNGEINTIRGNRNWVKAREADFAPSFKKGELDYLRPIVQPGASDSASADNALELLSMSGRDVTHGLMMLVPAAYQGEISLEPGVKAFYEFHECLNEPWDGPAALVASDGRFVVSCLDRNGLRPSRFKITNDGTVILSSEVGVAQTPENQVIEKGRLAPGEIMVIDTVTGTLLRNDEVKKLVASRKPYAEWVAQSLRTLESFASKDAPAPKPAIEAASLEGVSASFGFTDEESTLIFQPMFKSGEEAIGSMGDDSPLAVLSDKPRPLAHYFRQLFAQVTNPAIDPIREKLVMSTTSLCGKRSNWLEESAEHTKLLKLESPILSPAEFELLLSLPEPHLAAQVIPTTFPVSSGAAGFEARLKEVCAESEAAIKAGKSLIVLSDRGTSKEISALAMLLAVGAVHQHLIRVGLRMRASIIADTAEARDVQTFATLTGYGASAVNPYLAWEIMADLQAKEKFPGLDTAKLIYNYKSAISKGLLKIMSKMGISALASYHGGQIFESIGLGEKVIEDCFTGTPGFISGIGYGEIAAETLRRHVQGYEAVEAAAKRDSGFYRYRPNGEIHAITPPVIQNLHRFVGLKGADKMGNPDDYKAYAKAVTDNIPVNVRQLLRVKPAAEPISIDEVEPVEEIRRRFTTAGMSLGALSIEAHETLAIAMNRIGGKSNSGEGGEDKARFTPMENGDSKNSRIKQVASGRFGVTAEYLASATEIEIKLAQGAKPGEGGQLPGHKVSAIIARLRHSTPGVMLISPPPHHDIYSIEDLAQLIYDLKQVNPRAKVCVKLVAESGVGTIAAGVAKAHADVVLVSGHDGGTGASPLSSVKFAGSPWELGVAETQQVLLLNGLRNRITLRTDGGMRTGRDIIIAAMLGAEEFNFGTMTLLAVGCVYVRQCHLNTCPVGVATQDERLRAKYKGTADGVVTFLNAVAQEVREILATLGAKTLNEVIGHTEYLEQISLPDHPKANTLNLKKLLFVPDIDDLTPRYHTWERNDKLEDQSLDERILQDVKSTLQTRKPISLKYKVRNLHRCIGTQLSGEIAYRYGDEGLPDGTINLTFEGSAGQSFGTFLVKGVKLKLFGEANDYVGKGMNGGEIIVVPAKNAGYDPTTNFICGNTLLYGATGGKLFVYGSVGERFAVRNSGATAVVEGLGDHGCEYMTAGTVVVLGKSGKNFGAGMSGGSAYVLDEAGDFQKRINPAMVTLDRLTTDDDLTKLKALIYQHLEATESKRAKDILARWDDFAPKFWKVVPHPPVISPSMPPSAGTRETAPSIAPATPAKS